MGFFRALPEVWPGWHAEVWEDRFEVSPDAVTDFAVRPTSDEWTRFSGACDLLRSAHAA
jgi:hypothetical protein